MFDLLRLAAFVLVLIAVLLGSTLLQPGDTNDLSLANCSLTEFLFSERMRATELAESNRAYRMKVEKKARIVRELIGGHVTLFEAAATFRTLNQELGLVQLEPGFSGYSEAEAACLQVILWVRKVQDENDRFVVQLEEELRLHKVKNGQVILPDVELGH